MIRGIKIHLKTQCFFSKTIDNITKQTLFSDVIEKIQNINKL